MSIFCGFLKLPPSCRNKRLLASNECGTLLLITGSWRMSKRKSASSFRMSPQPLWCSFKASVSRKILLLKQRHYILKLHIRKTNFCPHSKSFRYSAVDPICPKSSATDRDRESLVAFRWLPAELWANRINNGSRMANVIVHSIIQEFLSLETVSIEVVQPCTEWTITWRRTRSDPCLQALWVGHIYLSLYI